VCIRSFCNFFHADSSRSRRKFRFKNKLMSLDGSIIELSATMLGWAKYRQRMSWTAEEMQTST
jgi:hypothetical protein